jgi:uncharacterized protein YhhL (DUF1145 family)
MWEAYKNKWKHNFSKSVGNRTGLSVLLFLACAFVGNLCLIAVWFIPLLCLTRLFVAFGLMPSSTAVLVATIVMQIIAFIQLVVFTNSNFGDQFVTKIAEKLEQTILQEFLPAPPILGLPATVKISDQFKSFNSYIPPVSCAPPRAHLA